MLAAQLWPACKLGIHVCNMGIPILSDIFCQGSLYFCQITQVSVFASRPAVLRQVAPLQ